MARTADDDWDIVTSVGHTALNVCAARALDSRLQPALANDDFAASFVAAAGEPSFAAAVANNDMASVAGFNARWVGVRTRFFDDYFARACGAGIRQAVILAAGLDCRGYRLAWPAGCSVFEVDRPQVLEFKQQVLDEMNAVPTARRVVVATDLRHDWVKALLDAGFDPARPTAWALEGLLMYLPGVAQDALFERLHEYSSAESQIAVELGPDPGGVKEWAKGFAAIEELSGQGSVHELWYDDPRVDTKRWLTESGWDVTDVDLVDRATNVYGRGLDGLPLIHDRHLRTKFFTARRNA